MRSKSNYRYYSEETIFRLNLIEDMKEKRLTLEEIREQLKLLDWNSEIHKKENKSRTTKIDLLREQIKQLEEQLVQLQPMVENLDRNQAALLIKQIRLQSVTFIQAMMFYIDGITAEIAPFL